MLFISRESFWLDEAFSIELAGSGWDTIRAKLSYSEINGAPHYVLLHFWLGFGEGEFAVRSLSVLAAVAAIPPFYATAERLFNARAARIGSLLLVTNSFFVYYEQEARSYALALLLVVLATYALTRWLESPTRFWTVTYAVTASLSIYAHLFSLFVIAAHAASLAVRRKSLPALSRVLGLYALLGAFLVPLMVYFATRFTGQLWWIPASSVEDLAEAFARLSGAAGQAPFPLPGWALLSGYLAMCCLALVAAARQRRADRDRVGSWPYALVLGWLLLPTVGSFLISLWKPIFVERYLLVALPAMALLAGAGLASIGDRRIRFAAAGALVALSVVQLGTQYRDETKEDWRGAVAHLAAHARPGDGVVIWRPYTRVPFEHYLARSPQLAARTTPLYPSYPWGEVDLVADQNQPPDFGQLARDQKRYDRVWLVLAHNRINEVGARTTERLRRVLGNDRVSSTRTFPGLSVTLERYPSNAGARPSG